MVVEFLVENSILLLFAVSAVGYAIGRIKIKGASLGVAAVLFVGLAVGALDPNLKLPTVVFELGLVLFVYTVGLASGPGFVASMTREGLRNNVAALAVLAIAALIAAGAHVALNLPSPVTAGLYAGALTNTPALAAVIETASASAPAGVAIADPTVGYSVAYPMGVLGVILVAYVLQWLWKIDYRHEAQRLRGSGYAVEQEINNVTLRITRPEATQLSVQELWERHRWHVVFSRVMHQGDVQLVAGSTRFALGDRVSVIGDPDEVAAVAAVLGEQTDEHLALDRSHYDFRRIFVSKPAIAGQRIKDLQLPARYGAIITRVRRGDVDLLADADMVLDLGDRVRVVAPREHMNDVSKLFGDSYKALSEIDLLSLGVGLVLGLLLGKIEFPLPGGGGFSLGNAGGPLIVGLILGAIRRTGPLVWTMPYSANLTVRQLGLIMLLASIGLRSGYTFVQTLSQGGGVQLFIAGAVISCATAFLTLLVGYKLFKIPFGLLMGMLSGIHTQPGVLGFAVDQSQDELPHTGYALMFPIATIGKILLAQALLLVLA
ncbi:MAG TPA: aspartate:alanine exchanger family transporter [Anaerolineae bacterium]|nr:aspartate:alanine exchanger family transporter [Anaerolineae bacterium]